MPSKKISFLVLMSLLFIAVISSANFAGAVEWTPLVRIPGLPATGTVNLSMYLIGLYNFMLSVVGIVAVIMLIIGGMRYITAVGNPTAISDAKDIINSAITGLILALLSWVFISAINPDVLYIKQPGSGITDPSLAVRDMSDCVANPCNFADNNCIAPGSPISADSPNYKTEPYNGKCKCIDQVFIKPALGVSCQDTCAPANCLVANAKVGVATIKDPANPDLIRSSAALQDSTLDNPIYIANESNCQLVFEGEISSHFIDGPIAQFQWDTFPPYNTFDCIGIPGSGACGYMIAPCSGIAGFYTVIDTIVANQVNCVKRKTDPHNNAWVCANTFSLTDQNGITKTDVVYIGIDPL